MFRWDLAWYRPAKKGSYGHDTREVPVVVMGTSLSGKRVDVDVLGPDGRRVRSIHVKPDYLRPRRPEEWAGHAKEQA